MSVVGEGGRLTARAVLDAVGWHPDTRLSLSYPDAGLILLRPAVDGSLTVTAAGHLRVPVRARRRVGLVLGDPVLLMAHRRYDGVLIHPPATLGELLTSSLRLLEETR